MKILVLLAVLAGCGTRDRTNTGPRPNADATPMADALTDASDDDAGAGDMGTPDNGVADMGVALVPDPGTDTNTEWTDVEPNDDPSTAVPQGILAGPVWMGFVMPYTTINDDTDVDYFVFRTGDAASLGNVYIASCWSIGRDMINLYLYQVDNGVQGALVDSAESTDTSCETIVDFGEGSTLLVADTVYLLEVRAAPGLALGADVGLYSA